MVNYLLNLFKGFINNLENEVFFNKIEEIAQNLSLVDNKDFINNVIEETFLKDFPNVLLNYLPEILS
jgi:hypothetical protein